MSIEFTGGFTLAANSGNFNGPGNYQLIADYRPANNNGDITIPNHPNNTFTLDFNLVGGTSDVAIYINKNDSLGNSNSAYLADLIGNHTHLTFSQGNYHITFDCENTAWLDGGNSGPYTNQVYYDQAAGTSPENSMSIISTSNVAFNTSQPISITITII